MKAHLTMATMVALCLLYVLIVLNPQSASAGQPQGSTQLQIIGKDGKVTGFVPLKHTGIKTEISGFVARIEITQEFENVLPDAVEAVYVFPLPHDSAVDGMTMTVGEREIRAVIKERDEARKIYEQARNTGHTAALLDQERPNIFTQSVTNIPPSGKVQIKLSVIELLKYEAGMYEFTLPLVVGPRYIPGNPTSAGDNGTMPNTEQVPDASRISPPVASAHTTDATAGHDVSMEVNLAAGVPVGDVESTSHKIFADRTGADSYHVTLADQTVPPNKDFILKYKVAGTGISDAILAHADKSGGYFTLILQPPDRPQEKALVPRQLIFVVDTSGSMWGFPLEMAKKTVQRALDNLRKDETFNLITFSGDTRILFPEPVPATPENVAKAKQVLAGAYGSGGTEMMKAIRTALGDDAGADKPMEADPIRVVCFITDGYVGNDADIIAEIKKHSDARVFSFGIGTAVNRFLLTKMAEEGHGDVEFVTASGEAQAAADRFYERVHSPVLTNIVIDWHGLPVTDIYPRNVRDLFSAKPVIITGRYSGNPAGKITIKGYQGTGDYSRTIPVDFSSGGASNAALEKIWARHKVEDLMSQDWNGIQSGNSKYKAEIVQVGLEHSLATQYTSFVAVEERTVVSDGKPVKVEVPVELPEGVSPLAVPVDRLQGYAKLGASAGSGVGGGFGGGAYTYRTKQLAPPSPSPTSGLVSNETVEVTADAPTVETSLADVEKAKKPGKDAARKRAEAKLSPELLTMYHCAVARGVSTATSTCKAAPAQIKVAVDLTQLTAGLDRKLAAAGLKIISGSGTKQLIGTIVPAQLKQLAQIAEVKSISLGQ
ncbi:MAG TPA: VIT domain-containing protein [Candidatus Polarisedimenticolia bacterium]|jgi:Ca-activated chloride channel family protein|nr:VIT domain-containing protein [Candidatus Polarisedimenticolia bacterium]